MEPIEYNRYWVWENNELVRKFASRIECEPYLRAGCTLTVLPKPKFVNPYYQATQQLQEALF